MRCNILILLPFIFFTLTSCQQAEDANEQNTEEEEYQPETITEYDSLGFPSYYTHPGIHDISNLRALLEKSDEVVGYNFNKGQENPAMMDDDNQYLYDLETSALIKSAYNDTILVPNQREELINLLCDSTNYTRNWSGLSGVCYIPHAGFGFFKDEQLVAQASVCFMCSGIRTTPFYKSDGLSGKGYSAFESFVLSIGLEAVSH